MVATWMPMTVGELRGPKLAGVEWLVAGWIGALPRPMMTRPTNATMSVGSGTATIAMAMAMAMNPPRTSEPSCRVHIRYEPRSWSGALVRTGSNCVSSLRSMSFSAINGHAHRRRGL